MKKLITAGIFSLLLTISIGAEVVGISQIDTSSLLLSQKIDLYLSIVDREGRSISGLSMDDFTVSESPEGLEYGEPAEILGLDEGLNREQGIHILLLLDNSGSMYDRMDGTPTDRMELTRTTQAREAVRNFIRSSFNPGDVISLASFNTLTTFHSEVIRDPSALEGLLETIRRPEREMAYTELYHALDESAQKIAFHRGRKVVVVLSDGENYPYLTHSGKAHPIYGEELRSPDQVIETYQKEGITLYAIHFGLRKDRYLGEIAISTGGNVYDARNRDELTGIYRDIKGKIEDEYRLTYRAGMFPSDVKHVRVEVDTADGPVSATRSYYSGTILGIPADPFPFYILLILPAAVLLWGLLLLIRTRSLNTQPALEILQTAYATKVSAFTVPLVSEKTVIGGGDRADLTISGPASLKNDHVTIVRDPASGSFTLTGDSSVTVNNRRLSGSRKLTDGDVLGIEGTTIVFDSGENAPAGKGNKRKKDK